MSQAVIRGLAGSNVHTNVFGLACIALVGDAVFFSLPSSLLNTIFTALRSQHVLSARTLANEWNRTRDLPVCSVVPYPLRHRAPHKDQDAAGNAILSSEVRKGLDNV